MDVLLLLQPILCSRADVGDNKQVYVCIRLGMSERTKGSELCHRPFALDTLLQAPC